MSAGFVALRRGLRVSQSYLFGTQSRFYRVCAFTLTLCDGDFSPPIVIKHSFSQGGRVGKIKHSLPIMHAFYVSYPTSPTRTSEDSGSSSCSSLVVPDALASHRHCDVDGSVYFLCPLSGGRIVLARPVKSNLTDTAASPGEVLCRGQRQGAGKPWRRGSAAG